MFPVASGREDAFTGLEVAITLIAFTIVASVFAYTVLGTGFMATQQAQKAVHEGLGQVSGGLDLRGQVMGLAPADGASIETLRVVLGSNVATGAVVDLDRMVVQLATDETIETLAQGPDLSDPSPGEWTVYRREQSVGTPNNMLEPNEVVTIAIRPTTPLAPRTTFSLELRTGGGTPVILQRTVPAYPPRSGILY
ncbi:MAG TPA: flagellin [Methanoregulaceae archaeon]|nr:flagellin [Methanoregulaceae archaeon]HQJ88521.1 flagellin [Methanoregulaceae archaeon]